MINESGKKDKRTWKRLCSVKRLACLMHLFLWLAMTNNELLGQRITNNNIAFIEYPDFPEGHSTWNDIGYNPKYNSVYIGVTNHMNKIAFYEYDATNKEMNLKGFIDELANLRPYQWQGKIHSKIITGPDGHMYFSTDGGESRQEYLMNNPQGYTGGLMMKWDPVEDHLTNLGPGLQYESLKDIDIDLQSGKVYAITYPQAHFLIYDPSKNKIRDLGRLGSSHVPRVLFTDRWGNCYYVDWRQRLVKYEKSLDKLVFAPESLPAFSGTPGSKIVTGITAYAKDRQNNIIYFVTYGAKVVAFHPQEKGIGKVVDLGGVADTGDKEPWAPYVPNLNLGDNGKLYYIIGGHGNYIRENKTVLMEFDPKTRKKSILVDYPVSQIAEATGSDTKDKTGNMYFLGRRNSTPNSTDGMEGSTAFLIKFNPEKKVSK